MKQSTQDILAQLEAESEQRKHLTETELRKQFSQMELVGFPTTQRIKFIADISGSNQYGYHYELICMDWQQSEAKQLHLEKGFEKHGIVGLDFLFAKLVEVKSNNLQISVAYLIAQVLVKSKHRDYYAKYCDRLIPFLITYTKVNDEKLRQKALIALGWVGTKNEINILTEKLQNDSDSLCRAWSASGLMQMSFNRVSKNDVCHQTKIAFSKAITDEQDLYACGVMLESAQTLFAKKWISATAAEESNSEKIEKARKSAVQFLSKFSIIDSR